MNFLFIRHLKTLSNLQKRYVGRLDEPLFEPEKQSLPQNLPSSVGKLYVSPMKRCLQTAEILYPGVKYSLEPGLREMDFGAFEGKTYEDLKEDSRYIAFLNGSDQIPEGDSVSAFKKRCADTFTRLIEESDLEDIANEPTVLICHGGVIMAVMEAFEAGQKGFYGYQVKNGGGFLTNYNKVTGRLEILQEVKV